MKNLCYSDTYNNILTISITKIKKQFSSTVCYRSPCTDNTMFLSNFKRIVSDVGKKDSIICGDFNYNLFNIKHHQPTEDYYNYMHANSYFPLISKPTRVTDTSATLIDHIWTNDITSTDTCLLKSGIIVNDITDHSSKIRFFLK